MFAGAEFGGPSGPSGSAGASRASRRRAVATALESRLAAAYAVHAIREQGRAVAEALLSSLEAELGSLAAAQPGLHAAAAEWEAYITGRLQWWPPLTQETVRAAGQALVDEDPAYYEYARLLDEQQLAAAHEVYSYLRAVREPVEAEARAAAAQREFALAQQALEAWTADADAAAAEAAALRRQNRAERSRRRAVLLQNRDLLQKLSRQHRETRELELSMNEAQRATHENDAGAGGAGGARGDGAPAAPLDADARTVLAGLDRLLEKLPTPPRPAQRPAQLPRRPRAASQSPPAGLLLGALPVGRRRGAKEEDW